MPVQSSIKAPSWLPTDPDPPGREKLVENALEPLNRAGGQLALIAEAGVGGTTVLGAIAQRLAGKRRTVVARLAGCTDASSVLHTIGSALGSPMPGDHAAVGAAIAALGPVCIILDDADVPGVGAVVNQICVIAPQASFAALGRSAPLDAPSLRVEPLTQKLISQLFPEAIHEQVRGRPLLGFLTQQGAPSRDVWSIVELLTTESRALAHFPAGVPGALPPGLPGYLCLPSDTGRVILRRSAAEAISERSPLALPESCALMTSRSAGLLGIGEGRTINQTPRPDDLRMLRTIAEHHPEKVLGARAAAAYIRLKATVGQGATARSWLARVQPVRFDDPETRGRVSWAEADTLAEVGEIRAALVAFEIARSNLRRAKRPDLLAHLSRRTGDRMVARGEYTAASSPYREARQLFQHLHDHEGLANAISGTASAAIGLGETVAAEALLDQASQLYDHHEAVPGGIDRASLFCAKATLYLSQNDLEAADEILNLAAKTTAPDSLNAANVARRASELACRERRFNDAISLVEEALRIYARTGQRAAVACSLRLRGDIAAAQGQLALACRMYRRSVHAHVRAGDLRGLTRVLHHHEALERESGDPRLAQYLHELRLDVEALLQ